jgi:hypothetical protein
MAKARLYRLTRLDALAHIAISYAKERSNNLWNCKIVRNVDSLSIFPNFQELLNDKPYYLLLKSYHTMANNPLTFPNILNF